MAEHALIDQKDGVASVDRGGSRGFSRDFGRRILSLRQRKGWHRLDLARRLGVSRFRLAKWENGVNEPPLSLLVPLARQLEVTLDELITGQPPAELSRMRAEQEKLTRRLEAMRRRLV